MLESDFLQERLFERRMVMLNGTLDETLAMRAAAQLMTLDASGDEPVDLYLDCPDGSLAAAFVLIDVLDAMQAPVHTHVLGQVGGPAIGVLAAGRKRFAAPNASFHLGEPKISATGDANHVAARAEQHRRLLDRFHARLAEATGRPAADIQADMERRRYLDAPEAAEYGLVDEIQRSDIPKAFMF